jgi:predicted dehydrogenase
MPVTTALIGAGNRGVAAHGQGAQRSEKLDLIAVCDVDAARAEKAAEQLGCDAETDHRKLLDRKDLQSVIIATGTKWHVPLALDFVRAGKHVLVEKPLSDTAAAGRELAQAARQAGVVGMVGYQWRFSDFVADLRREVERIDPIQALVTRQRNPFRQQFFFPDHYGGIMDALTHDIHLALYVMGASGLQPTSVFGSITRGTILGDETIEATSIVVECLPPDGRGPVRTAMLYGSMFGIQTQNLVQVIGLRGTVTTSDRKSLKVIRHGGVREPAPARPASLETTTVETAGEGANATAAMLDHFADLITGEAKEQRGATLEEGWQAVAVTQAAVESAKKGKRVTLADL